MAMDEAKCNYLTILNERKRYLTYMHMQKSPQDVEEMVKALEKHYNNVKLTTMNLA
jgi:hypothetical protein